MNVLFWPVIGKSAFAFPDLVADYMCDCLFHGLRSLLGASLVDVPEMTHVLGSYPHRDRLTGRGFTLYGHLPRIEVDRTDLGDKLKNGFFDAVVRPIHHTMNGRYAAVRDELTWSGPDGNRKRLAVVDGWDSPDFSEEVSSLGVYFKRELERPTPGIHPVSFAVPEQYIVSDRENKVQDFSPMIPYGDQWGGYGSLHYGSYIYADQESYYQQYRQSYFAYTCKKGGWDCLRHYEILACGTVPFFTDIEMCPPTILHNFPKDLCVRAKRLPGVRPGLDQGEYDPAVKTFIGNTGRIRAGEERGLLEQPPFLESEYWAIREEFLEYTRLKLTTKRLAEYILERVMD